MKGTLIYCYDAYCGWCYGFSPVMQQVWLRLREQFHVEVLSGGMILPPKPVHIAVTAPYIQENYQRVEALTGVTFGDDYLWHIRHPKASDWFPDSEKPAIAMCVFRTYYPDLQVPFAGSLQQALYAEGRDLCDDEAYRHLLAQYQIPAADFYRKLHHPDYLTMAHDEFALVKKLQVTGFPCVMLQWPDSDIYRISSGYTTYDTLMAAIASGVEASAKTR